MNFLINCLLLTIVVLFCNSCGKKESTTVLPEFSPEEHFQRATAFYNDSGKQPLAIWHLQEFLRTSSGEEPRIQEATFMLDHLETNYLAVLQQRLEDDASSEKDLKIRLLEENHRQLQQWLDRLNRDNFALREMLLDRERNGGANAITQEVPAAPIPPLATATKIHTVSRGETLSKIAQKYYGAGNPAQIRRILQANPNLEKNPNQLKIGDRLVIPND